ncbi:MAG: hypothetical protein K5787_13940, partial [Lentisphaeria bacterium]|nr:hypothetical protein [Lentisphaeria bacterium]
MPIPEISLAQFNRIASGKYNAGFVDFQTDANGNVLNELTKVNNHVHKTNKNTAELSPERVLEVKEAFINALERANVPRASIDQIREKLGIPTEIEATGDTAKLKDILETRFRPLTRMHVRKILDEFANRGLGFTRQSRAAVSYQEYQAAQRTANMTGSKMDKRREVNLNNVHNAYGNVDYKLTDVMSTLSMDRSLADMIGAQQRRIKGQG